MKNIEREKKKEELIHSTVYMLLDLHTCVSLFVSGCCIS